MGPIERVRDLAGTVCAADEVELVDIELASGVLRVTVDRPGGLDVGAIAALTRRISRRLDDDDPVPGRYTLEVSSPGLERRLRTPEHFRRAIGEEVSVRTHARADGPRRLHGRLEAADDAGITVLSDAGEAQSVAYDLIERARTVFEWGPTPKRGGAAPDGGPPERPDLRKKASKP